MLAFFCIQTLPKEAPDSQALHPSSCISCEVRRETSARAQTRCKFNSRTSCEVRHLYAWKHFFDLNFNSRTSCEVRRPGAGGSGRKHEFQLTHLLRGATPSSAAAGGDGDDFNSRTSCEVRRAPRLPPFQDKADFNSRTSCEVRRRRNFTFSLSQKISTHAPLARCDAGGHKPRTVEREFQLTHLLRGATAIPAQLPTKPKFQLTHLLRGATTITPSPACVWPFQLTHLVRGTTAVRRR